MDLEEALRQLNLSRDVDAESAKRAYLRLVKQHRPERDPEGFRRVRDAYEIVEACLSFRSVPRLGCGIRVGTPIRFGPPASDPPDVQTCDPEPDEPKPESDPEEDDASPNPGDPDTSEGPSFSEVPLEVELARARDDRHRRQILRRAHRRGVPGAFAMLIRDHARSLPVAGTRALGEAYFGPIPRGASVG